MKVYLLMISVNEALEKFVVYDVYSSRKKAEKEIESFEEYEREWLKVEEHEVK